MPSSFQAKKKGTELWPHILRLWGKAGQAWRRDKGVVGNGSGSCLLPEAVHRCGVSLVAERVQHYRFQVQHRSEMEGGARVPLVL